ncbi:MAG: membrane protein insertion efficiency factor YidD [Kiritimatiellae bacterium]|nr:membrane protein insertion efficiency factor YidD [Kiritimatiellia bacterium]
MVAKALIWCVRAYQLLASPLKGAGICRFRPTCSNYAIEALRVHGALKGLVLTMWRILRCNPWGGSGFDPVPAKGKWKSGLKENEQD